MATTDRMSFVTLRPYARRPIFQVSRLAERFIETVLFYRTHGIYKLHAFLVMPDQVHLIVTPRALLEPAISMLQQGFARHLHTAEPIWDDTFTAKPIMNLRELESLRTHLHLVPVHAQLAPAPELYPYSSAHRRA